jgi:hypothetical protein
MIDFLAADGKPVESDRGNLPSTSLAGHTGAAASSPERGLNENCFRGG